MNKNLNKKNFTQIKKLYWEEGYDQFDLGQKFGCYKGTVSRIINDKCLPIEERRAKKKAQYAPNFKAPSNEPKNAKTLRCKREELHSTKLTIDRAKEIRKLYFTGKNTQVELANQYDVNQSTICELIMGQTWKTCKC